MVVRALMLSPCFSNGQKTAKVTDLGRSLCLSVQARGRSLFNVLPRTTVTPGNHSHNEGGVVLKVPFGSGLYKIEIF